VRGRRAAARAVPPRPAPAPAARTAARLFRALARATPTPRTELNHASHFQLLVAVVLSAQATDKSVNRVTERLFPRAGTPQALLELGEARLLAAIRTIGLAPGKARNLIATSRLLLERHGGQVPATRAELEALPGVGRKTANVVLNVAFGEPTIAVDTHVFRVANRTGIAPGRTPEEVERGLLRVTPPAHRLNAHHYLILHGRYVCKARKPDCPACVIRAQCAWPEKTAG
jgi:endonuclease-3